MLFESVAFAKKLSYFTDQNRPKGGNMQIYFDHFQIQK